jgi:uncharacterized membrane protein YoaK (UPF0700 family)
LPLVVPSSARGRIAVAILDRGCGVGRGLANPSRRMCSMKLSAPNQTLWLIAVIIGVLGIIGSFAAIPVVTPNAFWFVTVAFVILAIATLLRGM